MSRWMSVSGSVYLTGTVSRQEADSSLAAGLPTGSEGSLRIFGFDEAGFLFKGNLRDRGWKSDVSDAVNWIEAIPARLLSVVRIEAEIHIDQHLVARLIYRDGSQDTKVVPDDTLEWMLGGYSEDDEGSTEHNE